MKRTLLFFTVLLSLPFFISAQQWALPSSVWRYIDYPSFAPPTYYNIAIQKDTIVDGKNCAKTSSYQYPFTYLQNDTVFIYINGQFRPTYHYNAIAGDTLPLHFWHSCFPIYNFSDSTVRVIVDSVAAVTFQNQSLRRFYVHIEEKFDTIFTFYPKNFYYTEKMGSNIGFVPSFSCYVDEDATYLCNYGDSSFTDFWAEAVVCSPLGLDDITESPFYIFPNPSSGKSFAFIPDSYKNNLLQISIFDAAGRIISTIENNKLNWQNDGLLPITILQSGTYFIQFETLDNRIFHQKFIVVE